MNVFFKRSAVAMLMALLLLMVIPTAAFGHAALVRSTPAQSAVMAESPPQVALLFNERIEEQLYSLEVLDEIGRPVTSGKPRLSEKHDGLALDLPRLPTGSYAVTYHVVSADGHPVDGTFVFTVGTSAAAPAPPTEHHNDLSADMPLLEWFQAISMVLYNMTLLPLAGWVLWTVLAPSQADTTKRRRQWRIGLLRMHLLALLLLIYFHSQELVGDLGLSGFVSLFEATAVGISWLAMIAMTLLGFVLLGRAVWLDALWVALLLFIKTFNGHAMAFEPRAGTLPLDFVHLASASLWVGGLLTLFAARRWRDYAFAERLLPRFSMAALLSIAALIATGAAMTVIFLPRLDYVFYSQWGTLLLIKIGLVLAVVAVAAVIRLRMRRGGGTGGIRGWLRVDAAIMALIVAVAALLTHLAPIPANEPLNWHEMGSVHATVRITPNAPGTNSFIVKVWLPDALGKPKKVELLAISADKPDVAPIEVPLSTYEDTEIDTTFDMTRYSYRSEGPYLPFAGKWTLQLRIIDANDDETVYETEMRIY